ncbi:MAG: biopolymer transporter ExbD [candidate division KSB1 bacterium]|nr:biopolymer transporter ExbD [candidate division KSB1 bacterium]MDZ7333519.1 biopolymer transporter ExbD [candidate division KSB1 bacterium]MDZ7356723.1 biopolymer transporter ExbD [candidate division KSB1 bacterium]MDZ7398633.1 biopolymer transporter ExbD [candidate division KSB1 bacterium]
MLSLKKKARKPEIPQASLADIAFLLLIFFICTTTIDVDKGIGLVLPPKGETKEVPKKNITNLLINAEGTVMLDENIVDVRDIRMIIQRKLMENPNLIVSVKTDPNTLYSDYIRVLDQLKQANATRISLAEAEK